MNKSLLQKDLRILLKSPQFFICSLILFFSVAIQFFFVGKFFVLGIGSTSLSRFFLTIPYVFSLIIPVLILVISDKNVENNFPFLSIKIILSKLFSILIALFLMIVPLFALPIFVNFFGQVDFAQVILGFVGILFYAILAISICLFFYEIFETKSAFIIFSIIVLLLIDFIHQVPRFIQTSDFFTNFFNAISFVMHFDSFSKGIVDTRDLFFFLISSSFVILFTFFYAEFKKGKNYFSSNFKIYSVLIFLILIFSFLDSQRIFTKIDFTSDKQFSISSYTKKNLQEINQPLKITYYQSKNLIQLYPDIKDIFDYLQIVSKENKNISLSLINADKTESQNILTELGVMPQQIQSVNNNKTEYTKIYSAIELEYLGHKEIIPFLLSTSSLEFELNTRLLRLVKNQNLGAYVLCGNEYSSNDYNYIELLLNSSNIICYPLSKESLPYIESQLEKNIPLLVFGTSALSEEESAVIENFILNGGSAFIATSPYSVNINGDWSVTKNLDDTFLPVLKKWGVEFEEKLVNDLSNVRVSFYSSQKNPDSLNDSTQYEYVNYPQWISVLPNENAPNGVTLFWPSPILQNENLVPLFSSSKMAWTVKELSTHAAQSFENEPTFGNSQSFENSQSSQTQNLFLTNPFTVEKSPINDPFFTKEQSILASKISKPITGFYNFLTNENPRVTVLSDQYFALNLLLELSSGGVSDFRNLDFLISQVLSLSNNDELLKLQRHSAKNTTLYKITDLTQFEQLKKSVLINVFVIIPILIILCAIVLNIFRGFKNEKFKNSK